MITLLYKPHWLPIESHDCDFNVQGHFGFKVFTHKPALEHGSSSRRPKQHVPNIGTAFDSHSFDHGAAAEWNKLLIEITDTTQNLVKITFIY